MGISKVRERTRERGFTLYTLRANSPSQLIPTSTNPVYLIKKPTPSEIYSGDRSVLFRCGNWCYCGKVTFDFSDPDDSDEDSQSDMKLKDIPRIIPMLQRQQGKLAFYCNATAVPKER